MNKMNIYKAAMERIKTSEDFNKKTLELLSIRTQNNDNWIKKTKRPSIKYYAVALVASIMLIMLIIPKQNNYVIELPNAIGNVKARYVDHFPNIHSSSDLIWLTEEEIFHEYNTSIFSGEVVDLKNIVIEMGSRNKNYRAIASIKIIESYRGNEAIGDIVNVLLPTPINTHTWVEDTKVISKIKMGTNGIFMPYKYDHNSIWSENNSTLYLMDIAEYGLLDGERFAFLQTENGIAYADFAYESIPKHPTMDQIKKYVHKMINLPQ